MSTNFYTLPNSMSIQNTSKAGRNRISPDQSTYLLPSQSDDSLPDVWELDPDGDSDNPSEISLRPVVDIKRHDFAKSGDKDGESSGKPGNSGRSSPSELSLNSNEELAPPERVHTAERDLKRKKSKRGFKLKRSKGEKNDENQKEGRKEIKEKKSKIPLGQALCQRLSFISPKDRKMGNQSPWTKHGFSASSTPVQTYDEPIEADSKGKIRTSQHMTAEVKIHFWRDKYEAEGRIERLLKFFRKKRFRRLAKTAIDLQTASLSALRRSVSSGSSRKHR